MCAAATAGRLLCVEVLFSAVYFLSLSQASPLTFQLLPVPVPHGVLS